MGNCFQFPDNEGMVCNIVIIGKESSGKTTLFNSIHRSRNHIYLSWTANKLKQLPEHNKSEILTEIRKICVNGITDLLFYANVWKGCKVNIYSDVISQHIHTIYNVNHKALLNAKCSFNDLAKSMTYIWRLDTIQRVYQYRFKMRCHKLNNLDYFMDKVHQIMTANYELTKEDMKYVNWPSVELSRVTIPLCYSAEEEGAIIDIERDSWSKWLPRADCIFYCCSLDEYCMEDNDEKEPNGLKQSMLLFEDVMNNYELKDSVSILLFLTKSDLFMQFAQYTPLTYCFPEFCKSTLMYMFMRYEQTMNITLPMDVAMLVMKYCEDFCPDKPDQKMFFPWKRGLRMNSSFEMDLESYIYLDNYKQECVELIADKFAELCDVPFLPVYAIDATDEIDIQKNWSDIEYCMIHGNKRKPQFFQRGWL